MLLFHCQLVCFVVKSHSHYTPRRNTAIQQMILFLMFKSESLNQGLWLKSACALGDTFKVHAAKFRGTNLTLWHRIKAFQLHPFCIRRWVFEDPTSLQYVVAVKMCFWCVWLWSVDERVEIFSPSFDVGTRAQWGQLTACWAKVIYF